jgi:hypothetical protein
MKRQNNKNESKFYVISIRWKIIKNNTFLYPKPVKTTKILMSPVYFKAQITDIHTYLSRLNSGGVTQPQIFLQDTHVSLKQLSYEEYCRRDRW